MDNATDEPGVYGFPWKPYEEKDVSAFTVQHCLRCKHVDDGTPCKTLLCVVGMTYSGIHYNADGVLECPEFVEGENG